MAANNILVIDANTNSFQDLVDVAAEMATFLNAKTVSVDEQVTTGNAVVNGSIQSTTMYANTLSGGVIGNTQLLTISTNTAFTSDVTIAGNTTITGNVTSNVTFSKTITGGASGNTANLVVSTNTDFNQSISVNTHIVAQKNITGNNVIITHTLAGNNGHTVFYSSSNNTIFKNDATGFRTSLDVFSKSEANTAINNKAAEVDASAIAYAIALG